MSSVPPSGRVWHKALLKVGPGSGPKPRRARQLPKCLGPRRHSPKKGRLRRQAINLNPPRRVKAWEEGRPPEARGMSSDETHPTRSVLLIPRPAKVWPIYWIQVCYSMPNPLYLTVLRVYGSASGSEHRSGFGYFPL